KAKQRAAGFDEGDFYLIMPLPANHPHIQLGKICRIGADGKINVRCRRRGEQSAVRFFCRFI
ncbi:MAG: hypothetical protein K2I01_03720, partial [Lachnospiraceae bacterium]|nr:hypothetical protein [Lachnospiraceae bacterium]